MSQEPLTARDLGLLIGVSEEVILAWVEEGMIPHRREGGELLFDQIALMKWLDEKAKALYGDDF